MHNGFEGGGAIIIGLFYLAILAVMLVANWKIVSKAGYSGVLSLLWLVPIVNIIFYLWFAFADWPARRDRRD